eukprot:TRINITY_DN27957_c0_g1_i1.p1 TRINITY_DN27957_c0_g1~~TRINITY_DN27957_c0_g1_i1.p1  ORF type:complete len:639 (+),score=175.28 TRINITY_DN27957_c0_g1_i1:132-2048(+)
MMDRSRKSGARGPRVRPEYLGPVMEAAMQGSFLVVSSPGPLSYVLKAAGGEKKFKVTVGAQNKCACMGNSAELCVHVMFVLLRIFKVDPENEVVWQTKFSESQITALLTGTLNSNKKPVRQVRPQRKGSFVKRKPIEPGDECPICYEEMEGECDTVWCRKGCGNNIHTKCMKEWAQHHGPGATTCPYCRTEWGAVVGPPKPKKASSAPTVHDVTCKQCKDGVKISGPRFTCTNCVGYDLCGRCAADPFVHPAATHSWVVRATPTSAARPVERASLLAPQRSGGSGMGLQGTGLAGRTAGRQSTSRTQPSATRRVSENDAAPMGAGLSIGGSGIGGSTVQRGKQARGSVVRGRPPQASGEAPSVAVMAPSAVPVGGNAPPAAGSGRAGRSNSRAGGGRGGGARVHRGRANVAPPGHGLEGSTAGIGGVAIGALASPAASTFSQESAVPAARLERDGRGYGGSAPASARRGSAGGLHGMRGSQEPLEALEGEEDVEEMGSAGATPVPDAEAALPQEALDEGEEDPPVPPPPTDAVGAGGERVLFTADEVQALPVTQWMEETPSSEHACAVCEGEFEFLDVIRTLPLCGHSLHSRCAEYWLTECSAACPECGTVGLNQEPMTYPLRPRAGSSVAFAVPRDA